MAKRKTSLEEVAKKRPDLFGQNGKKKAVQAEATDESGQAVSTTESDDHPMTMSAEEGAALAKKQELLLVCGDGFDLTPEQAEHDIIESAERTFGEFFLVGKRLMLLKHKLPHGQFQTYVDERCPFSHRVGQECMLMARRILGSPKTDVRAFLDVAGSNTKKKALMLLGVSDDEIDAAIEADEFLGRSLEDVGQLSYRQLQDELRKAKRDRDRARTQRDQSESKKVDMQEQLDRLTQRKKPGTEHRPLTPLELEFSKTVGQHARLLDVIVDAPEDELVRDGQPYLTRLNQDMRLLAEKLLPFDSDDS